MKNTENKTLAMALIKTVQSNLPSVLNSQRLDAEMKRMGFTIEETDKLGKNCYRKKNISVYVTSHELYFTDFTSKFVTVNTFENYNPVMDWLSEAKITLTWEGAEKALQKRINN